MISEARTGDVFYPGLFNIVFNGEKLGDDDVMFNVLAPYVEPESYIEMVGEDHYIWRWVFVDGKCVEKAANISFD